MDRRGNPGGGRSEGLPWHLRNHALFVAFAPVDDPEYAIAVVVEHGEGGSKAAAPIARDIMDKLFELHPVAPPSAPPADAIGPV